MRARRRGVILATASIAGLRDVGYPHLAYGATKAFVLSFSEALAIELAAARVDSFGLAGVASRLDGFLSLLAGGRPAHVVNGV